jgi:hypothetical protein
MSMAVACDNDGFLASPIGHATKPSHWIFVSDGVGIFDIQSLFQVHAGAKGLIPGAGEDGRSQLGLGVIPSPQEAEFNSRLYGQAIPILWSINGDEKDMFSRKRDQAMLQGGIRVLYPFRYRIGRRRAGHCGALKTTDANTLSLINSWTWKRSLGQSVYRCLTSKPPALGLPCCTSLYLCLLRSTFAVFLYLHM